MPDTYDRDKAKAELTALGRDARMYLQDTVGNNLTAIALTCQFGNVLPYQIDDLREEAERGLQALREVGILS